MDVASKMSKMIEDTISEALIKAVQNLSVEIDEEELLKRLRDSKKQYQRGYEDREQEIVRCKDCMHRPKDPESKGVGQSLVFPDDVCPCQIGDNWYSWMPKDDWFCADGERHEVE